ncbi:tryptophan synthase beta subunit-like PLP-dependent enzyme [Cadophora sp. DSE1049]|nr:tryptophan synthase beta subunit-like PLP-dependent enzyme [Cadophora sp. DSE1049]
MPHPPPLVESALDAIGKTPVIRLRHIVPEPIRRGDLKPGMTVVEASVGSTGSSLAFVCAAKGYKLHVVSLNAFAEEKLRTMGVFDATVEIIKSPFGRVTKDLIPAMVKRSKELAEDAFIGYAEMANELVAQFLNGIDACCSTVGTAGMVMVVICEPAPSLVLTTGCPGSHYVEGVGIGYLPPLVDSALYDEVQVISENEGRKTSTRLATEEALLVGTSTGLNVVAAIALAQDWDLEKLL